MSFRLWIAFRRRLEFFKQKDEILLLVSRKKIT